jgi:hypothetical protein
VYRLLDDIIIVYNYYYRPAACDVKVLSYHAPPPISHQLCEDITSAFQAASNNTTANVTTNKFLDAFGEYYDIV